eukprot:1027838-Pelagomonas_calceolata.AAC.4
MHLCSVELTHCLRVHQWSSFVELICRVHSLSLVGCTEVAHLVLPQVALLLNGDGLAVAVAVDRAAALHHRLDQLSFVVPLLMQPCTDEAAAVGAHGGRRLRRNGPHS